MNEFEIIQNYFRTFTHHRDDVILGSGDDCAILHPPKDQLLVSTIDTMNEGMHFLKGTPAKHIGYKSIAISLSDIAAMGAEPAWVIASLSLPVVDQQWIKEFADGFFELFSQYNLALVGGDLVQGPLAVTTQLTGFVPPDKALKRTGASVGDLIYVTGTIGDARHALELLRENKTPDAEILNRLTRPTPRIKEGIMLRDIASSCIDLSDGLLGDLAHLLKAEKLGADIDVAAIPSIEKTIDKQLLLTSGDDYELCFTVPEEKVDQLTNIDCTRVGQVTDSGEVRCFDNGEPFKVTQKSWQHFSE